MLALTSEYAAFCATHRPRTATLKGHVWTWREAGHRRNPPLLMLPGALGRPETSFEYMNALSTRFQIIAPGYPATINTMTGFADGCAALLERCRIPRAAVVGGSFGGLVAQTLAWQHPDRVSRLVLSDTSPPKPFRAVRMRLCAALLPRFPAPFVQAVLRFGVNRYVATLPAQARPFWRSHFHEMLNTLSQTEIENRARAWAEFDTLPTNRLLPTPDCLLLCAASDRAVSPRAFQALFPSATVHIVQSPLGHAASIGDAGAYITPMRAFLEGREP